jgi:HEPN domain
LSDSPPRVCSSRFHRTSYEPSDSWTTPPDLGSAEKALDGDLAGAYQLAYDGARKAVTALLAAQGLRVRARAGHSMLVEVVVALYGGHEGGDVLAQLDRMRRIRNEAEYAGHWFDEEEVAHDLNIASRIVEFVIGVLGEEYEGHA